MQHLLVEDQKLDIKKLPGADSSRFFYDFAGQYLHGRASPLASFYPRCRQSFQEVRKTPGADRVISENQLR